MVVAAAISVALLGGCGGDDDGGSGGSSGGGEAARLMVREELPAEPRYTEGSVAFLELRREGSDDPVFDGRVTDGTEVRGDEPLLDRRLPPGDYTLVSYQRPCLGNCDRLDPPTDRCSGDLTLARNDTVRATVVLRQEGGCTIRTN